MSERCARTRIPFATLALVIAALVIDRSAALSSWASLDREAFARGELWRVATGHLVHEVPRLALMDLLALALVGSVVERMSRSLWVLTVASGALLSSLAVLFWTSHERYVGSSALVSALIVAAAVFVLRRFGGRGSRVLAAAVLLLFAGKLALELAGLWPAALTDLPSGYEPAAVAHIAGGLAGMASALLVSAPSLSPSRGRRDPVRRTP